MAGGSKQCDETAFGVSHRQLEYGAGWERAKAASPRCLVVEMGAVGSPGPGPESIDAELGEVIGGTYMLLLAA